MNPLTVLDIGANVGEWTEFHRILWPQAHFTLVEANPGCEGFLQGEDYRIALLGSEAKDSVPFYTLSETATGASVYRELTGLYEDVEPLWLPQTTLDELFPERAFELLKIDTQGSEMDILRGGERIVQEADCVILEVSYAPYNAGAPLEDEVRDYMAGLGFSCSRLAEYEWVSQRDFLFKRGR